jgi:hypothetical protein
MLSSRIYPALGRRKAPTAPGNPRKAPHERPALASNPRSCRCRPERRTELCKPEAAGSNPARSISGKRKMPFAGFLLALFPPLATAVRARCERTSNGCRPHSSEVESRALVDRSRVTSSTGAGLTCRRLRVRVPSLRSRKTCKSTYSVAGLDTAPAHAPHAARARAARNARKPAQWRPRVTSSSRLRRAARPIARGDRRAHRMAGGQERRR